MSIKFRAHPFLRPYLQNQGELEIKGATVGECICNLDQRFPGFKRQILNKQGKVRDGFEVFINSDSAFPNELGRPVKDGDVITIIAFIAGG
jgi:molybdopterin converting factor small subunit